MNFYLCLASLCSGIAAAAPQLDASLDAKWNQWKSQHRRIYGEKEHNQRRAIWEKNLRMIEMHNQEYSVGNSSFHMEMNKFGDMTNEEFRQVVNGLRQKRFQRKTKKTLFREPLFEQIPEFVDWRNRDYVTPVKDQGQCASSWAFSAAGSIEGQWFRKTGKFVPLSEQNLVDCAKYKDFSGCDGGFMTNAFEYVKTNGGIDTEESYPYEGMEKNCQYQTETTGALVFGYVDIPSGQESTLTKPVATVGPISVAVDGRHPSLWFYRSGIYYEPECSSQNVYHGMLVVGYGVKENGEKYCIVKNSWGKD